MKKLLLPIFILLSLATQAQQKEKTVSVKTYGFIGFDAFVDTRESVAARGGHGYLYPKSFSADANGSDKNDKSKFDFGAGISRLGFAISGPDAFGAKTTAKIEGDFAGASGNSKDFAVRLRHAFLNLKWNKTSLLAGQTWHPLFIPENFPATVNFVVGLPFHPLSRNPQLRFTYSPSKDLSLILSALSQGDFKNSGALEQVEYADIPEFNFQLKYGSPKDFFLAATVGVKQVQPLAVDDNLAISEGKVTSAHANLSAKLTLPAITIKAEGVYGGNMTNQVMIGGIARKANNGVAINDEFEAIRTSSVWTDIHSNNKKIQWGFFAGYTQNHGTASESIIYYDDPSTAEVDFDQTAYTRGWNIEYIYNFSPRVKFYSGPLTIGLEWLYTVAAYGTPDVKSRPKNSKEYANNRLVLGFRYNF
ncbi:DcaP family trimeric outer membrane transporter [Plebeiibacterium marinum]|uniref:DcaP family trimeric outer membrane transporter n=1 Tax=Plebeiibacterium marinum TaxID=2992111 RepID=A0AAE3MDQ7_9BACT|nr:DcaP family trimeric outer membrane transporter [Plebeiobacterium marinum]MCW3805864.1 DcaP family trimeric outer membrane transporter [Plebeiobacterium marinum]